MMESASEDRDLVLRMRSGDEAAFRSFADHYIAGLHRFAMARLGADRELTKEVVAATVCKAIEKLDGFRGEATLFTWLCAVCRNEIAAHFRRRADRPVMDIDLVSESDLADRSTPEVKAMKSELDEIVHRALDHLPARYALALRWKYIDGVSVEEIARRLDVGCKAAESILTRSRRSFRVTYEQLTETKR